MLKKNRFKIPENKKTQKKILLINREYKWSKKLMSELISVLSTWRPETEYGWRGTMENQLPHFLMCDWIHFPMAFPAPPWNLYLFFINSHNIGTGGSMQEKVRLWKHVSCEVITQIRLVNSSPVDTHWAFMQAKNISPFLSSPLLFILHVRALLGAAGPSPNWALQPPSCKVVGCQTSPDLQLGAHAMRLLLWAIKGKWERDVQIPLAILT